MVSAQVQSNQPGIQANSQRANDNGGPASAQVDRVLRELLLPENRALLEECRLHGSSNRVYKITLDPNSGSFVIVKLLPSRWSSTRRRLKKLLRGFVYGEHEIFTGKKRVRYEIERAREWLNEGLPVPAPVDTTIPDARVFQGLPFPTFFTVLEDPDLPIERKLDILGAVTRSLSSQHQIAWKKGKQSLIHPDPGPWNIMYDAGHRRVYWFDLEHPASYPHITLETLTVRALRIYLYGVLDHLECRLDDVVEVVAANYDLEFALWGLLHNMRKGKSSLLLRMGETVGLKKGSTRRRGRIAAQLATILQQRRDGTRSKHAITGMSQHPAAQMRGEPILRGPTAP